MSNLKNYFLMIREREKIIEEINNNKLLSSLYGSWSKDEQEDFLNYCTGERGLKICYDPFFKEIFNVEYDKSRLDSLLSSILGEKVEIIQVLPNEGARIASESNLLITDILVRLENGSLVNVEIQKIGYSFPGERASCYSADLLLREYKRIRDKKNKKFKYSDIMPVYTIVIFEESPAELKKAENYYIHRSKTIFDTGIKVNLLQKFIFISLDNFKDILQNRIKAVGNDLSDISSSDSSILKNSLEEWLMFLSVDEPDLIELLIRPYFKTLYSDIYEMCLNTERLMSMYSKVLAEYDHNTVIYMMDELKAQIDEKDKVIAEKDEALAEKITEIERLKKQLSEQ